MMDGRIFFISSHVLRMAIPYSVSQNQLGSLLLPIKHMDGFFFVFSHRVIPL